ncbi:MAG: asparagine synthase (glutamine-hydrolyzing) [Sinobacteraceae bacterium]|nr:asparagine synthase (glutamine-hydrolyzing) [Nevskiaceae bacterium]MCP5339972.1 asparagine synthase (glutamine-hydrolyzing) [Nevskiaceae bacterium]MCP5360899.1 asparagine synthase (glutamine-hydrolyzing) [Nevskiaceae bacterium]MCP5467434.1 asparagine synthase (glutamine-hydrolyzing) [Nevskiaceae bacterium]MCP5470754.1 asparagine synthase (glutamine-hydrolyzing) [Nevskiaceae bacterium]
MCGIAGFAALASGAVPERRLLERMIGELRHRGPDGFGFHQSPGIGLAHARLSIIDLSTGDQPIRNEDGSVWVVFNGEIFNYLELRQRLVAAGHRFYTQSDTEVIVHAYEEFGLSFVEELNGQFAIALWDARLRRLVLARDRIGIRPLLYARCRDGLLFASEAKSLFASGLVRAELDPVGIAEVATFWSCIAPRTAFAGIEALPPGHLATWQGGRLEIRRYWDWDFPPSGTVETRHLDDVVAELRELFVDCVRLQLRADVPVGAYLSGGLDSSAVTAAIRRFSDTPLKTFSLTFADTEFDEREFQDEVSRHLGTDHVRRSVQSRDIGAAFPRAIRHIEAPIVRTAGVPLMLLADRVRETGFKVVLTGEGADEVFGGYDLFKEGKIRRFWGRQPKSVWRPLLLRRLYGYLANSPTRRGGMASAFFGQALDQTDDPYFAHRPRWATTGRTLRLLAPEFRERIDAAHPLTQLAELVPRPDATWAPLCRDQYVEAHTLLTGYLLAAQGDRVAMAASIEGRYPFLDHRLIEFANRLPPRWKIRGLEEKFILRRAVADWLPQGIARRTKQPYRAPDSGAFFRDGQPLDYVAEALCPASIRDAGYFEPAVVATLLDKCRRGAAIGFADNMAFVTILSTQLLHREFVARQGAVAPETTLVHQV